MSSILSEIGARRATQEDLSDLDEYQVYDTLMEVAYYEDFRNDHIYGLLIDRAIELYNDFVINKCAGDVVFVAGWASPLEKVRKELLVGLDGRCFQEMYLAELGIQKSDVKVLVESEFRPLEHFGATIVTVGTGISDRLRKSADLSVPHPSIVRKASGNKGSNEVSRKMDQVKKILKTRNIRISLDSATVISNNEGQGPDLVSVAIKKSTEKQIVYGVVMSSYGPDGIFTDAHGDYCLPSMIEAAAHNFVSDSSRTISLQHSLMLKSSDAKVVESHIEPYPTKEDYLKAMAGEDHAVTKRVFGDGVVHSGDWVLGVKLSDPAWELFQKGEINAFSPGGAGVLVNLDQITLPNITFMDKE